MERLGAADRMVRLGIVGSGRMARTRAANAGASSRVRLVAVASRNAATGQALADASGCAYAGTLDTLLARADLDAVAVCTTNAAHGEIARAVLGSGRHALVEYPLAIDPVVAVALVAEARRRGLSLQTGYDQAWLGPHAALREAIARDGPPLDAAVRVAWAGGDAHTAFRRLADGGPPALVKSYYLYALLDWLGLPEAHHAVARYTGLTDDGYFAAATHHLTLLYPATVAHAAWLVGPDVGGRRSVDITLTWHGHTLSTDSRTVLRRDEHGETALEVDRLSWDAATRRGLDHFAATILDGAAPRPDPALAAETVRLATASALPAVWG